MNTLKLAKCTEEYWDFVRLLRMDERVRDGFIEDMHITKDQQVKYMTKYADCFRIALLDGEPVGYYGVIDDDIRVCTHPDHFKKGIGKFLVAQCAGIWPDALAKIKVSNEASKRLFESCGYKLEYFLYKHSDE